MGLLAQDVTVTTRDSVHLAVRPAERSDALMIHHFFQKVSDEDRRFRFLSAQAHVSPVQILPLVEIDHWQTENFLAFDVVTGALVASAMLACDPRMDFGEIAVSIRADYKGRGVGWAMLDLLGEAARERGLKKVIAIENRANHEAIALERERGFEPRAFAGDPNLVVLTKTF